MEEKDYKPEVNVEALESLTVSDLTSLLDFTSKDYQAAIRTNHRDDFNYYGNARIIIRKELDKRLHNVFIR